MQIRNKLMLSGLIALLFIFMIPLAALAAGWQPVGTAGFSDGEAYYTSLYVDNGTPYVAYMDGGNAYKATVKKYDGISWVPVGSPGFSTGTAAYTSLYVYNGTPYVAYQQNSGKATVMKYNGATWEPVGAAGFSAGTADYTSLYVYNNNGTPIPYVAYRDVGNNKATVKKYEGGSWVPVGAAGFSAGAVCDTSLYVDNGTPYVAYRDVANGDKATVMKYNGATWEPVGAAGFSAGGVQYTSLCVDNDGTPYVAYRDNYNYGGGNQSRATVMKYNGATWEPVGAAGFSPSTAEYTSLYIYNGTPYLAYKDGLNGNRATVKKFNGTSWVDVGTAGFSAGVADYTSLYVYNGTPYVAYQQNSGKATVMMFATAVTSNVTAVTQSSAFSQTFNLTIIGDTAKADIGDGDIALGGDLSGLTVNSVIKNGNGTVSVQLTGSLTLNTGKGTIQIKGSGLTEGVASHTAVITVNPGNDAGLTSVATQTDGSPAGGNGTAAGAPVTWSVNVPNATAALALADIVVAANATKNLYSDAAFTAEIINPATLPLTAGGSTIAYIKVTAQDTTTIKYYAVTVNRAPSSDAGLTSVATQTDGSPAGGNGNAAGTPVTWSVNVPNAKAALALADIAVADNATKNLYSDAAFTAEIINPATLPLTTGGSTVAYVKVTAQDTSTIKYYAVTVNRAAASDASLANILGQAISAGTEDGTALAPKTASISVANAVATVAAGDVAATDAGATVTFYGTDNNFATAEAGSVNLAAGGATHVYIKVVAADNTTLYYNVTINRAADPPPPSPVPAYSAAASAATSTPAAGANDAISLTVKDSFGNTDTTFSGAHNVTLSGYTAAPDGTYGSIEGATLTAPPTTISVTFTNGAASINLALNNAAVQTIVFAIAGVTFPVNISITVLPSELAVSTAGLPAGRVNTAYSASLAARGGTAPYTWSATGLPPGLLLSPDGALSGTPSAAGTSTITITVHDSGGKSASKNFSLTINSAELLIITEMFPEGTVGEAYSTGLAATGGTEPYSWSATGLPPGLSINPIGVISGNPSAEETSVVTVTVTDSKGLSASKNFNLSIITLQLIDFLLDQEAYTLKPGDMHQTAATAVFIDQSIKDVTAATNYSSSDPSIVTVDATGKVVAIGSGTATITADYGGKTSIVTVTVQDAAPEFTLSFNAVPASVMGDGDSQVVLTAGVTSSSGKPVQGIPVTFRFGNKTQQDSTVVTDARGNAVLTYTAPDIKGIVPVNEVITATARDTGHGLTVEKSITMHYLPASVRGVVLDQVTGRPVAGAVVSITADFNSDGMIDFSSSVTTGVDGLYEITVPRGNFNYTINIQMLVQIGSQTTQLNLTQTASVGALNGAGQVISPANNVSGQLLVAGSSFDNSQMQNVSTIFGANSVQVLLSGGLDNSFRLLATVDSDGDFLINNVPQGQYQISYQVKAPDGTILAGPPAATVNVDGSGQMSVVYSLIDPYGIVTDSVRHQPVSGVNMQLYWADTALNKQKGRIPDTLVNLPILENFMPNQNKNPQITNNTGEYAWMVYPDADYYIIAGKDEYKPYSTLDAKPNAPAEKGSDSYIQDGIIHVGQAVIPFSFSMTEKNSGNSGGGGGGGGVSVEYIAITSSAATTSSTPVISGTTSNVADGTVIKVSVNGQNYTTTVNNNTWTVAMTDALPSGTYTVRATIAGTSATAAQNLTVTLPQGGEHQKYVTGYPDGNYKPDQKVSRAEIAAMLQRVLQLPEPDLTNPGYPDVTNSYWGAKAIAAVTKQGIMTGYPDGTFRPEQPITREEMASVAAKQKQLQSNGADTFKDTRASWAKGAIGAVKSAGIIKGYPDGTFKPEANITRAEAVSMINRMVNRGPLTGISPTWPDVDQFYWAYGDIEEASMAHTYVIEDSVEKWVDTTQ